MARDTAGATAAAFHGYARQAPDLIGDAAGDIAADTASAASAAGRSSDRQSARVAATVTARRGAKAGVHVGGSGAAGRMVFGSEFGGRRRRNTRQFRPFTGQRGYWLYPTIRRLETERERSYDHALQVAAGGGPVAERDLNVNFTADTTNLERGATRAGGAMDKTGGKMSGFADKAKKYAAVAGAAMAGFALKWAGDGMKLAADTAESLSKVQSVFGDAGTGIDKFAKTTSKSLGISRKSTLEAAGNFGNMFDQLGVGAKPAADMSKSMITLAADLGSFNNADPTEVLESMGSTFRGEYDSLQKFVPTINAARVEQEAMAETGKTSAKQLTAQEKAMATYTVMTKDAGKANGDFAKTQDSTANQQRIMQASMEDLQASIGAKLLPVMQSLLRIVNDQLLPAFEAFAGFVSKNAAWFGPLAAAIATVVIGMKAWTIAQAAFNAVMALNPVAMIIIAIIALVAALVLAYQKSETFRAIVNGAFTAIQTVAMAVFNAVKGAITGFWTALQTVFSWIQANWPLLLSILGGPIGAIVTVIIKNWDTIKSVFQTGVDFVRGVWDGFIGVLRTGISVVTTIMGKIATAFQGPLNTATTIVGGIQDAFGGLLQWFRDFVDKIARVIGRIVDAIKAPINAVVDGINAISFTVPEVTVGGGEVFGHKLPSYTIPGTGKTYDPIPHIPSLAAGAMIRGSRGGTLVRAGENYSPEVIGPLRSVAGMGSQVNNYTITVAVAPGSDPVRAGAAVVDAIRSYERANGSSWRTAPV